MLSFKVLGVFRKDYLESQSARGSTTVQIRPPPPRILVKH